MLERAKTVYSELSDLHHRSTVVSKANVRKHLSDLVRGRRKKLTEEMQAVLADWAAWSGQLPEDEILRRRAQILISEWNRCGPFSGSFNLGTTSVTSITLAAGYLGSVGLGPRAQKQTLYKGLSTEALDAAAFVLRDYCPAKWYVTSGEYGHQPARKPSRAEVWLLEQMRQIDTRIDAGVVRAVITRTSRK